MVNSHDLLTQEYIEVIRDLEKINRVARVKDIARARGVTCANVSVAMNNLAKKELINHEQYGHIVLTAEGNRLARTLERRHQGIKKFLVGVLMLDADLAETEACKLEHVMSPKSLQAMSDFLLFVEKCPKHDLRIAEQFKNCGLYSGAQCGCRDCAPSKPESENSSAHA